MSIQFDRRKRVTHRLSTIRAALEQPSCFTTRRMRRPKHSQLGQDLRSQVTRWKLGRTLQDRASDHSENCTCGEHHSKFAFTTSSLRVASSTFGCIDRPKPMRLQQPPWSSSFEIRRFLMPPESRLAPSAVKALYALGQQRLGRPPNLPVKLALSKRLPKRLLPRTDQLIGLVFDPNEMGRSYRIWLAAACLALTACNGACPRLLASQTRHTQYL